MTFSFSPFYFSLHLSSSAAVRAWKQQQAPVVYLTCAMHRGADQSCDRDQAQLWLHMVLPGEEFRALASVLMPCFLLLQGKEMLTQKLPLWQQSCSDPNKIPDRAIQLMQQMAASSNGTIMPSPLSTSKSNLIISDPIPGAKPLPVPPELAPFVGVSICVVEVVLPF